METANPNIEQNHSSENLRVERWQQKLLDLSLRNRLLNVRDSRQVLPLLCPDIDQLEDFLADNQEISIHPISNLCSEEELQSISDMRLPSEKISEQLRPQLLEALQKRRIHSFLPETELKKRIKELFRKSRTDQEESGVNTLFLGIGFLEWKNDGREEKSHFAPILLLPVRLSRKTMSDGIKLSKRDEETMFNVTLGELLRREFHISLDGMDPLPQDRSGVDIPKVLGQIQTAISRMGGWKIHREARLGIFSFGKFIMWNDLTHRTAALTRHPLVNHLISGSGIYDDGIQVVPPEYIGPSIALDHLFCPMSADASQLTAVYYSELGKSFVLHGPPGTGKSQTITNIIAHNLAIGRRVLFVSEKKAALDVVHRRLTAIGLKPFCLELHSNKSGKSEVLAQFAEALHAPDVKEPSCWQETIQELGKCRSQLNGYVEELHRKYPNDITAYQCFSALMKNRDPIYPLNLTCIEQLRNEYLALDKCAQEFLRLFTLTTNESRAVLQDLRVVNWTPTQEKSFFDRLHGFLSSAQELLDILSQGTGFFQVQSIPPTPQLAEGIDLLFEALIQAEGIPTEWISLSVKRNLDFLQTYAENAIRLQKVEKQLSAFRLDQLVELDVDGIQNRIQQNQQKFFLTRFFANHSLLKELNGIKKIGGTKLTLQELSQALPLFKSYQICVKNFTDQLEHVRTLLGRPQLDRADQWPQLNAQIEALQKVKSAADHLVQMGASEEGLYPLLSSALSENQTEQFRYSQKELHERISRFQEAAKQFSPCATSPSSSDALPELIEKLSAMDRQRGNFRTMMMYLQKREEVNQAGAQAIVDALEAGEISSDHFLSIFHASYLYKQVEEILEHNSLLAQFIGKNQNEQIKKFCELDDRYIQLSRKIVFAKLAERLPRRRSGPCPEGSELGILKHECEKRSRQKPVRKLLEQIPTLVKTLKPCFLMSPLSVAQYLSPEQSDFDLIVFDEASQIPVWDAIGVIARGKQLIVVGDPKQMPPTNFFQKNDLEETDEDDAQIEDLESILDECIAAGIYSTYLNWHYRSRHESLIAFSNQHYYENRLCTFPSARNGSDLGVSFVHVPDGIYDRRKSRTNLKEAETLVNWIFDRIQDPNKPNRSIGVVTFSEAQQGLIEDLVDARREKNPQLESFFSDRAEEPFFVKNLENVQGDERDIILFSVGYAPDTEGKMMMNFGPLNRDGGERRLNVAITRAKEQVVLFSSIHGSDIDLSRTGAQGAADLRSFLEYAEKGENQPSANEIKELGPAKDTLVETIAAFLHQKGYSTVADVGSSLYRISLAVQDPEEPDEYLLGIECDGPIYAKQRTTRDREHIRASVLRSLGWHLYRAWSVDWSMDRTHAEESLLRALENAKEAPSTPPTPPQSKMPVLEPMEENTDSEIETDNYTPYAIWTGSSSRPQESFYELKTIPRLRSQINQIVQTEAPIFDTVLKRRLARAWGFSRIGAQMQSILDSALPSNLPVTHFSGEKIYWRADQDPDEYKDFRVPRDGDERRDLYEIPPQEIINAMKQLIADFNALDREVLYKETVKIFGFASLTGKMRELLDQIPIPGRRE